MTPEPSAAPSNAELDAFDRILDESPTRSPEAADPGTVDGARTGEVQPRAHESAPSLEAFVDRIDLYRDPILCAVLAGVGLAGLGVFVVLRRAVFVTAALSQAAGLGVALAFYAAIHQGIEVPPVLGALGASIAVAVLALGSRGALLAREARVGIAFVVASALAVLVGTRIAQEAHDISAILFGSAVLVRTSDLVAVAAATVLALVFLALLARPLAFTGFDPEGARVHALPVRALEIAFWAFVALEVSVATRALGALPVFAFSVLPPVVGLAVSKGLFGALAVSVLVGGISPALGYVGAYFGELPVGATQAAVVAAATLGTLVAARVRRPR
nr:MAG: ABC transporter permease [Pseudomonadota bacterium]